MKNFRKNYWMLCLVGMCAALSTSCKKDSDPEAYAPPFTVNGYKPVRAIAHSNLVGYWAFENSVYDSVQSKQGTVSNVTFAQGFRGQGLQGSATGYGACAVNDKVRSLNDYTISFWMKYPSVGANTGKGVTIVSIDGANFDGNNPYQTGSWDFYKKEWGTDPSNATASYFGAKVRNINGVTNYWDKTAYLDNLWTKGVFDNWVQWTFTYNSATTTFNTYLNGKQWASDGFVDGGGSNTYPLVKSYVGNIKFDNPQNIIFGANTATGQKGGVDGFPGLLDEVRVYNTAFTESQVDALVKLQIKGLL